MKKKLVVSFSGGETSAFMAQWLWRHKQNEYDIYFVFANTGEENEETLKFVQQCSSHFGFHVTWIEAVVNHNERKGTGFKEVTYHTASRNGEPFEDVIKKYGIPNVKSLHCSRELKERPISSYIKYMEWDDRLLAIGIRNDEIDRQNKDKDKLKIIYPLIYMKPMTKSAINFYWSNMPFRLELKGYEGNCKTCWKKSDNKLYQIAKDNEHNFYFMGKMELRYDKYIPESRLALMAERGEYPKLPIRFFRKNRSVQDIINESKNWTGKVIDDSMLIDNPNLFTDSDIELDGGSCEVFSNCSDT